MSELNGFTLMFLMELLVRDHTLVLCLKAALTCRQKQRVRRTFHSDRKHLLQVLLYKSRTSELRRQWNRKTKNP